jgi:ATP-dependent DNA ligase
MAKQPRLLVVNCHRPVNWNEAAMLRCIESAGYVIAQTKKDGLRFHAFIAADGEVYIVTREGIELRSLALHKERLRGLLQALPKGFYIDGEAVVPDITFEACSGLLRRFQAIPLEDAVDFWVWDTAPLGVLMGDESSDEPLTGRIRTLIGALMASNSEAQLIPMDTAHSIEELNTLFDKARDNLEEGLVVKDPSLHHRNGKVTGAWKMKPSDTCDGRIVGFVMGTPGLGNAGYVVGFTVELEDGTLCDATGLTQEMMDYCTTAKGAGGQFSLLGRYVEVSYMEKTASGSLRHPNFVQFRDLDYAPGWKS